MRTTKKLNVKKLVFAICFTVLLFFSIFNIGKVLANNTKFELVNITIDDKSSTTDASIVDYDNDTAKVNVVFHKLNDYVVYRLLVKNISGSDFIIDEIVDNESSPYVEYEYDSHSDESFENGTTKEITVKATYKNEVTDVTKREQIGDFKLTIKFKDNGEEDISIISPKTGDNIVLFIIIGFISLLGLGYIFLNKNKKIKKHVLLILLLLPVVIKAYVLNFDISFDSNVKLHDKLVVTLDNNGEEETVVVPYGQPLTVPADPVVDGYDFDGWYVGDTPYDFSTPLEEDQELVAKFTPINYQISIELNGGSVNGTNPNTYNIESDPITLINPTKDYYDFAGWLVGTSTEPVSSVTIPTGSTGAKSYTATYTPKTYNITYNLDGGSLETSNPTSYNIESTAITLNNPSKQGYNFAGWSGTDITGTSTSVTIATGSHGERSYTATYTPKTNTKYTVYHHYKKLGEGYDTTTQVLTGTTGDTVTPSVISVTGFVDATPGEVTILPDESASIDYYYERTSVVLVITDESHVSTTTPSGSYPYGTSITLTKVDKDYYDFAKWSNNETTDSITFELTSQTSVGPVYTPTEYAINYNLNNGTLETPNPTTYNIESGPITLNNPTLTGYDFTGWSGTDITGTSTSVTIPTGSHGIRSYTANFTGSSSTKYYVNHYYETLNGDYELTQEELSGTTGSTVYPVIIHVDGFVDPDVSSLVIGPNGDSHLDYYYNRNRYALTIENEEYVSTSTPSGDYPHGKQITLTRVERDHYDFAGWSNDNVNTSVTFTMTGSVTIGPVYTPTTYNITYDLDGGSLETSNPTTYNIESSSITLNNPTKEYYDFVGWSGTGITGTSTNVTIPTGSTGARTYTAVFTPKNYTISYTLNDGSVSVANPTSYNIESSPITLNNPTRTNYDFTGWSGTGITGTSTSVTIPTGSHGDRSYTANWTESTSDDILCRKATSLHTKTCDRESAGCVTAGYTLGGSKGTNVITFGNIASHELTTGDAYDCDVDGEDGFEDDERFYYIRTVDDKAYFVYYDSVINGEINSTQIVTYNTIETHLPTTWNNVDDITEGVKTRIPTRNDVTSVCSNTSRLDLGCEFFLENSQYHTSDKNVARSAIWLEKVDTTYYRIHTSSLNVGNPQNGDTSENMVRPVIEVPLNRIEVSYMVHFDPNGGELATMYYDLPEGDTLSDILNELPTPTRDDYIFAGWYTETSGGTAVSLSNEPNNDVTYYARWSKSIALADIENTNIVITNGQSRTIEISNASEIGESYHFSSSNDQVVSVTQNGTITASKVGQATITITGETSNETVDIAVTVVDDETTFTLVLDVNDEVSDPFELTINPGDQLGELPTPDSRENYTFGGWFTDATFTVEYTSETVIEGDSTGIAKWIPNDAALEVNNNEFYSSFASALTEIPNSTETHIKVLKDMTEIITIPATKELIIDLNGKTISTSDGEKKLITNNGSITISNGSLSRTGNANVIENYGYINMTDLTISTNAASQGAVNNRSAGTMIITDSSITHTGGKQAIYNEGGSLFIYGNTLLQNKKDRAALHNLSGGYAYVESGTIISTNNSGIKNEGGIVELGKNGDGIDTSNPEVIGSTMGVDLTPKDGAAVVFKYYDGIIKGKTSSGNVVTISDFSKVTLAANTGYVYGTEGAYDTLTLETTSGSGGGNEYVSSDEIVEFRTTNDAMATYYQYIDTWKNSSSNFPTWSSSNNSSNNWALDATENTAMMQNFNSNNCMCADNQCNTSGTVNCDKPKGYDTTLNETIKVYLSSEANKEKGAEATYAKVTNGVIYNLIPDQVYYWEVDGDSTKHGYVKFVSERRILETGNVRNVRDLGGLPVDVDGDSTIDGHLDYGRLFRGIRLESSTSVTELTNLGINSELDLREANSDTNKISRYNRIEAQNYYVNPLNYANNPNSTTLQEKNYYNMTRAAVKYAMEEIAYEHKNLYFHCRIGTDRTGTVAYVLEGLLGVPEEDRIQDYELSFFYGLVRIHRYHNMKPGSSVGTGAERFTYMHDFMDTNSKIYAWYMYGSDDPDYDNALIEAFRNEMIVLNSN